MEQRKDARWLEKLTEHAVKVLDRGVDKRLRESVDIDGMQFGFMKGMWCVSRVPSHSKFTPGVSTEPFPVCRSARCVN